MIGLSGLCHPRLRSRWGERNKIHPPIAIMVGFAQLKPPYKRAPPKAGGGGGITVTCILSFVGKTRKAGLEHYPLTLVRFSCSKSLFSHCQAGATSHSALGQFQEKHGPAKAGLGTGFPSGIAARQRDRAVYRFMESMNRSNADGGVELRDGRS